MSDVQRYETEGESKNFDMLLCNLVNKHMGTDFTVAIRKSLSTCRALLEKHQWDGQLFDEGGDHEEEPYCKECFRHKPNHAPDCAIDAQLAGTRGGE